MMMTMILTLTRYLAEVSSEVVDCQAVKTIGTNLLLTKIVIEEKNLGVTNLNKWTKMK